MQIKKAFRFKLKPNEEQAVQLSEFCGCARFVWNKVWSLNKYRLENKHPLFWYSEADFYLKLWKGSEDYGFLKKAPSHVLQQKLKDLDKAMRDGFNKAQPLKRLPHFKKKGVHDSIRFSDPKQIKVDNRRIQLPKLGWIRFHKSQELKGTLKNVTISQEANGWFLSIQVEEERKVSKHPSQSSVGIDVGIARFATLSTGKYYEALHSFKKHERKLAKAQRELSKKKKFSSNWKNQKRRISRIHHRIANCRKDRLHWVSTQISKNHALIVLEDLKVKNMSKSARGNRENPGRNVRAKSGLNKSILDQGWGMFRQMLEYKQRWQGGEVLVVDPKYTSQTCPDCYSRHKDNRRSQALFCCESCGYTDHADVVGAKNILAAGHAVLACGESGLPDSMKQEPVRNRKKVSPRAAKAA